MEEKFLEIVDESGNLNSKLFSLIRIKILWALSELGEDGATARQIKNGLNIGNDGSTYSNLNALTDMGYLRMQKVPFESKENLELYTITPSGLEEWNKIKKWLVMLIGEEK
ncbi:transcriptional regulator [Methanoplanus endosymbiosus]|uniref:Transcriptional regulator n=1 Tax=Methanoplanus endosymbiosus TaxID=33865 RepID=A0A9E7PMI9_9EURY|nr:transcriptional regulator [Methanoplanus endosymbiosus]UUX92963.1 transcriptional regulator [Methanoplanus endosymbiosus]